MPDVTEDNGRMAQVDKHAGADSLASEVVRMRGTDGEACPSAWVVVVQDAPFRLLSASEGRSDPLVFDLAVYLLSLTCLQHPSDHLRQLLSTVCRPSSFYRDRAV
jgi:hypothetical protein